MAEQQASLPASVEGLIERICVEQNQPPLDFKVRQRLAAIGEKQALQLLYQISNSKIRKSLSAYIMHMLKQPPCSISSPSKPSPSPPAALPSPSDVLSALGELEFRKAFLLLSYVGRESIENVVSAEDIRSLKDLPMRVFENEIWEAVGKKYIDRASDRQQYLEWDSGRTHVYQCSVSRHGSLRFKGPILQPTRTHLQKSLGDDNVLVVKFAEDQNAKNSKTSAQEAAELYGKFGKEGIRVGLHLYRFFGNPFTW